MNGVRFAMLGVMALVAVTGCGVAPTPGAGASASTPSASPTAQVGVDAKCFGDRSEVRPTKIMFACADGGYFLTHLHWSTWGSAAAVGTGTAEQNDCAPDCADGHFHAYPAQVVLSQVRGGRFTHVSTVFIGPQPIDAAANGRLTENSLGGWG